MDEGGEGMRLIDADALQERAICGGSETHGFIPIKRLWEAPTVDPEPIKGKWMKGKDFPSHPHIPFSDYDEYCSVCEHIAYWSNIGGRQLFDYCPYCGADMRELKE